MIPPGHPGIYFVVQPYERTRDADRDYQIGLLRSLAHNLLGPLAAVNRFVETVAQDNTRDLIETRVKDVETVVESIMKFSRAVMRDGDFQ